MPRIMADNNVQGHLDAICRFLQSKSWKQYWDNTQVVVVRFTDVGLEDNSSDRLVWQTCQNHDIVLLTGNRNQKGPDSLEETIQSLNQADSLPVITLGNPRRFWRDRPYGERAAIRLLEYLSELDKHRGTGRIYIP